jgi:clan AA aspartic protease
MGLTNLPITVSHPANPKKSATLQFMVDSGAIYSVVPTRVLGGLGIKPEEEREFILANGQKMVRQLGIARFAYKDRTGGASVIFGQKDDNILLGATTLEAMGFVLNPFKRDLLPLPMVLG